MLIDSYELACFIESRLDGRALEAVVRFTKARRHDGEPTAAAEDAVDASRAVVFLHAYAPLGGNMRNKVLEEIDRQVGRRVGLTIGLNMRGAGRSEGRTSWTGQAEQEDVRSLLDMLQARRLHLHAARHPAPDRRALVQQLHARGFAEMADGSDGSDGSDSDDVDCVRLPRVEHTLLCGYSYGAMISGAIVGPDEYPQLAIDHAHISYPYGVVWALALHRRAWYLQRLSDAVAAAAVSHAAAIAGDSIEDTSDGSTNISDGSGPTTGSKHSSGSTRSTHQSCTLFVAGTCDSYTAAATYTRWWDQLQTRALQAVATAHPQLGAADAAQAVARALAVVRVANADHGWVRREAEVVDAIDAWWR
ncbi:hypothetical protein LPJ53_000255 [Coemansia erecta]|uniref:AB hydrolase-1 domain-containing protein n=1 Tax=Coemansia erecta TaxID=147472 RepID=A0A9W7Y6I0_9FUNG|nr:hypothetical protein LPJ53_000255 [Coemansia erecta]